MRISRKRLAGLRSAQCHKGAVTVEFAVCLPVVIVLVFGAIEASSFIFLKQSLNAAAYEGVREAIRNTGTSADGQRLAENVLSSRSVEQFAINFPTGPSESTQRGEPVVIEVSAPAGPNSPLLGQFINSRTITARAVMMKE